MTAFALPQPLLDWRRFAESRLIGMRANRWSWWTHWRELADYFLPRRYKWVVTPNQMARGSPINQHILDSTGCLAARNLASGLMSGKTPPTRPWFKLKIGDIDSTQTTPISLWLSEVEKRIRLVLHEGNFYNCMAQFYYDLVIFGTAVILIYEDFENVINSYNPCAGEYYIDIDGSYRPVILYREFTMTVAAVVNEFGLENCSASVQELYNKSGTTGANLTREIIVAHAIEPNDDGRKFGIGPEFTYRECYWEWGGSTQPQSGSQMPPVFLRTAGFYERPHACGRWDIVSNDPYGRSVGMDALPDQKQLQLETRRKSQAIDKQVNPPLVADIQLKNQPASLLPGGMTYISGYAASGKPAIGPIYDPGGFRVADITADLLEVRERLKYTFYNHLFQPISQFQTRSNVTAVEIDQRKAESLIMLGPVFERIDNEVLKPIIERVYAIMFRAGLLPEPPPEISDAPINIDFVSMLANVQDAIEAASIERGVAFVGNLVGVKPDALDNIDVDYTVDKYFHLLNNDPKIVNSPERKVEIRQSRAQQEQAMQQAEMINQVAQSAKNLASADMGGGTNALTAITGGLQ